ncbi:MAG: rod shape-determining protein MreD [Armatimonadetes bacterium]|nr:rod shape-determining protein MreD [Armatimonadota bacterium]
MRFLIILLIFILSLILEGTVLAYYFVVPPQISLLIIIILSFKEGSLRGFLSGLLLGVIQGMILGEPLGIFTLSYGFCGFLIGSIKERFFPQTLIIIFAAILGTLIYFSLNLFLLYNFKKISLFNFYYLPYLLIINLIFVFPVYYIFSLIFKKKEILF